MWKPSQVIFFVGVLFALAAYNLTPYLPQPEDDPSVWYNRLLHAGVLCWLFSFYRTISQRYNIAFACWVWVVMWWQIMNTFDEWIGNPYTAKREEYLIALFGIVSGVLKFKKTNLLLWVKKLRLRRK